MQSRQAEKRLGVGAYEQSLSVKLKKKDVHQRQISVKYLLLKWDRILTKYNVV